jgi:hypothetical protein
MRVLICSALALLAGCSPVDPCDGLAGTCLTARVDGQPAALDQLRISVEGRPMPMSTGASFTLPVQVAIAFTVAPGPTAHITIDGLVGGDVVSSSGDQTVALNPGGKATFNFQLLAGSH